MRNEAGVSKAGLLSDGLGGGGGGLRGLSFCRLVDRKKKKKPDMDSSELVFEKKGTLQKWEMKIKVKTSFLFVGECPSRQVVQREAKV